MHRKRTSDQQVFLWKSGGHFFRSFIDAIAALQQQSFGAPLLRVILICVDCLLKV